MKSFASTSALLATLLSAATAQTHTACNPLNTTGCPPMQALGGNATFNFATGNGIDTSGKVWNKFNNGDIDGKDYGATFTIARSGDAPMVQSKFYMLFGRFECIMQAAKGQGIVSSVILQSEDLDEIDWEFLGSNDTHVMTNYFGKGNTTAYDRGKNFPVNFAPQDDFHNYTVDWTKDRIQWWVDGNMLRELAFGDALGGRNYPQTPMNIRIGVWAGGDKSANDPGVVSWAGGVTNFKEAPFTMVVKSVYAQDYTQGATYTWDDMDSSGDWQKVKVLAGTSPVLKEIQKPTGIKNRWERLPQAVKIGILAGIAGVVLVCFLLLTFCCIKQRRAGRREHAAIMARDQQEAAELEQYKRQMQSGQFGFGHNPVNGHNNARRGPGPRGSGYRFSTNRF